MIPGVRPLVELVPKETGSLIWGKYVGKNKYFPLAFINESGTSVSPDRLIGMPLSAKPTLPPDNENSDQILRMHTVFRRLAVIITIRSKSTFLR